MPCTFYKTKLHTITNARFNELLIAYIWTNYKAQLGYPTRNTPLVITCYCLISVLHILYSYIHYIYKNDCCHLFSEKFHCNCMPYDFLVNKKALNKSLHLKIIRKCEKTKIFKLCRGPQHYISFIRLVSIILYQTGSPNLPIYILKTTCITVRHPQDNINWSMGAPQKKNPRVSSSGQNVTGTYLVMFHVGATNRNYYNLSKGVTYIYSSKAKSSGFIEKKYIKSPLYPQRQPKTQIRVHKHKHLILKTLNQSFQPYI